MSNPPGTPIWYELVTADPDAAARFYGAAVGWTLGPNMMPDGDYRMIEAADGQAGGVMRLSAAMARGGMKPGWLMYLGVDDVDEAARDIADAGGTVLMAPWTLDGVGRMAFVAAIERAASGQPEEVARKAAKGS